jgi:hypothetical protein
MKFSIDCYPCAVRQALRAIQNADLDENQQFEAMRRILLALTEVRQGATHRDRVPHPDSSKRDDRGGGYVPGREGRGYPGSTGTLS